MTDDKIALRTLLEKGSVVGIFPNEAAVTRLIGALLPGRNDEWAVQRARYIALSHLRVSCSFSARARR